MVGWLAMAHGAPTPHGLAAVGAAEAFVSPEDGPARASTAIAGPPGRSLGVTLHESAARKSRAASSSRCKPAVPKAGTLDLHYAGSGTNLRRSGACHDLPPAVRQRVLDLQLSHRQPPRRRGADPRPRAR